MLKLDDEIDALFQLPLAEFIGARKTLAARLKKDGRAADAERVKLLTKPSISAWAVNQLHWQHREVFARLIATGQRFHKAQTTGKVADMREALEARREALSELSDLATAVLHNPGPETLRRVNTTLEAMSAYGSLSDSGSDRPTPGRLTADVDPPGFESFAGLIGIGNTASVPKKKPTPSASKKSVDTAGALRVEISHQTKIAAAKVALQNAKRSLTGVRATVQDLEAQQKQADTAAMEAERLRREAEKQSREVQARLKKAAALAEDAQQRTRSLTLELRNATKAFEDAKRAVDRATTELESLFRKKP